MSTNAPIAIIGLAGRFPGAADPREYFAKLLQGADCISRFSADELEDSAGAEVRNSPQYVRARPILEGVERFDAAFFGMQPREAELTDPQQRVFLECSWEALEDAGYDPARYGGAIGVFGGCSMNTYFLHHVLRDRAALEEFTSAFQVGCYPQLVGAGLDFLATRVAYKLDLRGPAITLQSACSTSLLAVAQASQSLQAGQCDMALAGGVSISFPQKRGYLHQAGGMVSADGRCRPFDAQASGTVFGSGAGVLLLKRLDRALADRDHIYALIRGCGVNNDGATKVGFTAPSVEGQARAIEMALHNAGVEARSIGYVECHGTATPLGDPIELAALQRAYRASTSEQQFCAIGSAKGNVGHLDAAAGAAGLIKVAMALDAGRLPGTVHYEQPNPQIDFESSPFYVQARTTEWPRSGLAPRRAGISSLGVGGTNVHVVAEEAPPCERQPEAGEPQLLLLSARSEESLAQARQRLGAHLRRHEHVRLADAAFTLQQGRRAFGRRLALVCRNREDAIRQLGQQGDAALAALQSSGASLKSPALAFMFPGQGAQHAGMTRDLYREELVFRAAMDRCAAILEPHLGQDLRQLLYPQGEPRAEDQQRLQQTAAAQPALFAVGYALAQLWLSRGLAPAAMIGHSVGEFVAAVLAGVMSLEDAALLVAERGRLMQALPPGAMLAVRMSPEALAPLLDATLSIAAVNAPGLCVASGPIASIESLEQKLAAQGAVSRRLHTSHAFHSPMLDPVIAPLLAALKQVRLSAPQLPYVSCVSGDWITPEEATSPEYWARHAREPVQFARGVATLAQSIPVLLEVGPGATLSRLAPQAVPGADLRAIPSLGEAGHGIADTEALLGAAGRLWVAGVALDWTLWQKDADARRVPLPAYAFDRQRHWIEAPAHSPPSAALEAAGSAPPEPAQAPTEAPAQHPLEEELGAIFAALAGAPLKQEQHGTSFLELGFDSLFLAQVTQRIQNRFKVEISFRQLLGELSTFARLSAHLQGLQEPATPAATAPAVEPAPVPASCSLTEGQMEIWLATQAGDEASCAFNQSITLRLDGALDPTALQGALNQVIARHDALRARFSASGEQMHAMPAGDLELPLVDLGGSDAETALAAQVAADSRLPFDLVQGPVVRARLFRLGPQAHALLFSTHHIVCDGWSLNLIGRDLARAYASLRSGSSAAPAKAPSFLAYARAEQAQDPAQRSATERHWAEQFRQLPPPLSLPSDRPPPPQRSYAGARLRTRIDRELYRRIKSSGAQQGATLFVTLLSVFQVLVGRLAGENDVVIGVPTAGQRLPGMDAVVGHCVHFLPLRGSWSAATSFAEHLQAQAQAFAAASLHPRYTLATLLRQLEVKRSQGRNALGAVHFNLETRLDALEAAGVRFTAESNPKAFHNADLCLNVLESGDGLQLDCDYSSALFDEASIARWLDCYRSLLQAFVEQPRQPLRLAPLLPAALRQQVLRDYNRTAVGYPREQTLHGLFEQCARAQPEALALRCGDERLTYGELEARSARLARTLAARTGGSGGRIGVLLRRSAALPVALLAVLKAGHAYVPLDPGHPPARLRRILADAGIAALLCDAPPDPSLEVSVPVLLAGESDESGAELPAVSAEATAYVIYTSGSTGMPKGVQLGHRGVVNFLCSMAHEPGIAPQDVVLAVTTISFDIAVLELFLPLTRGASVILATEDEVADGHRLRRHLEQAGVTLMQATPATWSMLLETGWKPAAGLKMLCGGEALPQPLAKKLLQGGGELWNMYGPTETTVWSSCTKVQPEEPITVGRPIANTCFYVLDSEAQPQPPGVPGELYIGGDGVALGYHQRPELTAEKFVANPFGEGRLYRTGDLALCLPDGRFQVLGRIDHQVKLRGFRIELGEIEAALHRLGEVAEAAVILREDVRGAPRLAAYYVARSLPCPAAGLRKALQQELPDYMVPTAWTALDALPRLPNGKLDRAALPEPEAGAVGIEYVPPTTTLEQRLARIWAEVLRIEHVSTRLDLFEFGADSIQLFQITARARRDGVRLSARQLLEHRTIAALARSLELEPAANDAPPRPSLAQFRRQGAGPGLEKTN